MHNRNLPYFEVCSLESHMLLSFIFLHRPVWLTKTLPEFTVGVFSLHLDSLESHRHQLAESLLFWVISPKWCSRENGFCRQGSWICQCFLCDLVQMASLVPQQAYNEGSCVYILLHIRIENWPKVEGSVHTIHVPFLLNWLPLNEIWVYILKFGAHSWHFLNMILNIHVS